MPHDVIATCPVCASELAVTRLRCGACGTTIEGEFSVGRFASLTREQTQVLESFLRHHHAQGLSSRLVAPEELFHPSTHESFAI